MDKKGKILIVEDDKTIREELQMTLMAAGYEARIMEDFSDPAGSALAVKPDLILLDVNLPKKSLAAPSLLCLPGTRIRP